MSELREKLKKYERDHETKVKCDFCGFRCLYCPLPLFNRCKKLIRFLDTGAMKQKE